MEPSVDLSASMFCGGKDSLGIMATLLKSSKSFFIFLANFLLTLFSVSRGFISFINLKIAAKACGVLKSSSMASENSFLVSDIRFAKCSVFDWVLFLLITVSFSKNSSILWTAAQEDLAISSRYSIGER